MNQYTIYTMQNCPHCTSAKELFKREGLSYTEITHFTREELTEVVGPVRTLPQILVQDLDHDNAGLYHIGGFSDLLKLRDGDLTVLRKLN